MIDSIISRLAARHSVGAKFLTFPVPTEENYRQAVSWAVTAPDHGRMFPARFVIIDNREKFADFFESGALGEGATAEEAKRARDKAIKAPAFIAVVVRIEVGNPRIPPYEQWMTAGACVTDFLSALELQGFAGKIVSGSSTRYPDAVKALCKKDEVIACWIMLGTPKADTPAPQPRVVPDTFLTTFS